MVAEAGTAVPAFLFSLGWSGENETRSDLGSPHTIVFLLRYGLLVKPEYFPGNRLKQKISKLDYRGGIKMC